MLHPDRLLEVTTAEGARLLRRLAQPWGDPAAPRKAVDNSIPRERSHPDHVEPRIDLGSTVSVLMAQAS